MCKDEANSMFDSTHLCEMHVPWLVHSPTEVLETDLEFYAHAFLNFLSYKFEYICIRCRISADEEWKPVWKRLLVPVWTVHRIWEGFWNGGNEWMEGTGGWGLNTNSSLSVRCADIVQFAYPFRVLDSFKAEFLAKYSEPTIQVNIFIQIACTKYTPFVSSPGI